MDMKKKGFLRIKIHTEKKASWPQSLFCFSSVPILFVHMRNKFFYMSAGESLFPPY